MKSFFEFLTTLRSASRVHTSYVSQNVTSFRLCAGTKFYVLRVVHAEVESCFAEDLSTGVRYSFTNLDQLCDFLGHDRDEENDYFERAREAKVYKSVTDQTDS